MRNGVLRISSTYVATMARSQAGPAVRAKAPKMAATRLIAMDAADSQSVNSAPSRNSGHASQTSLKWNV